jgi:hypothetical protein
MTAADVEPVVRVVGRVGYRREQHAVAEHARGPRDARACVEPFSLLPMMSRLWLGEAREQQGNQAAACDAYAHVLQRWGHASPRSVTADEARRRSDALGCR